jgi:mannan endo-1,4-beta-mannosidase
MKRNLLSQFLLVLSVASFCMNSCSQKDDPNPIVIPSDTITSGNKPVYNITSNLIDPSADEATKKLYAFIVAQFGKKIISGQTEADKDFNHIKNLTGNTPLIRAYDMQPYCPMYSYNWANGGFAFGADTSSQNVNRAISWYKNNNKKPIITFQWHWHSPSGGTVGTNTFYTENTTFDVAKAVVSGTQENQDAIRDIDAIAVQLKKLRDAGVPVLWRPLHEAGGTWFWWSAKGGKAYKALWDIIYERLTNYHQLHNLIWVWTGDALEWFPGNDKVDIAGIDSYPGNKNYTINKEEYDKIYGVTKGAKILAMTENGPIPDIEMSLKNGVQWSFFMSWYDVTIGNDDQHLKSVYQNPKVITLENYQ